MNEKTITFVTGNPNKLREFVCVLGPLKGFNFENKNLDIAEYQGEIEDICIRKCEEAYKLLNTPVVVEDTSLCFKSLGGLPGPYIKWFLQKIGPVGLHKMLTDFEDKTCTAICTIGFAEESGDIKLFQGETEGIIVYPRGSNGFGWDKCFQPKGYAQTYAELPSETKNQISHRYKAILKLKDYFETQNP